jgi:large-conductance mechanosensitive channel
MNKQEFIDFVVENKLMTYSAGVVIGLVSKDVILSLVQDIIIPIFFLILIRFKFKMFTKLLPHKDKIMHINLTNFVGCLITWIIALFCTFIFVQYTFVNLLGIKTKVDKTETVDKKKTDIMFDV